MREDEDARKRGHVAVERKRCRRGDATSRKSQGGAEPGLLPFARDQAAHEGAYCVAERDLFFSLERRDGGDVERDGGDVGDAGEMEVKVEIGKVMGEGNN